MAHVLILVTVKASSIFTPFDSQLPCWLDFSRLSYGALSHWARSFAPSPSDPTCILSIPDSLLRTSLARSRYPTMDFNVPTTTPKDCSFPFTSESSYNIPPWMNETARAFHHFEFASPSIIPTEHLPITSSFPVYTHATHSPPISP